MYLITKTVQSAPDSDHTHAIFEIPLNINIEIVSMALHPFADLSTNEIEQARKLVQELHPQTLLSFKAITLEEPEKSCMIDYLEAEHSGSSRPTAPQRVAYCVYYIRGTVRFPASILDRKC